MKITIAKQITLATTTAGLYNHKNRLQAYSYRKKLEEKELPKLAEPLPYCFKSHLGNYQEGLRTKLQEKIKRQILEYNKKQPPKIQRLFYP